MSSTKREHHNSNVKEPVRSVMTVFFFYENSACTYKDTLVAVCLYVMYQPLQNK